MSSIGKLELFLYYEYFNWAVPKEAMFKVECNSAKKKKNQKKEGYQNICQAMNK